MSVLSRLSRKKRHPLARALAFGAILCLPCLLGSDLSAAVSPQAIETVDGVRIVHNPKGGVWGANPKLAIELVRTIGDVDTDDENLAFDSPVDMAVDEAGNIFILDSGNQRIQVFGPDSKYVRTIGRRGQGPGEFASLNSIAVDRKGNFHVLDDAQKRIQVFTPQGEVLKTIPVAKFRLDRIRLLGSGTLVTRGYEIFGIQGVSKEKAQPKLVKLLGPGLEAIGEFGEPFDYGDEMTNRIGNSWYFDVDGEDHIYLCFVYQNRVERYSPEGRLLWRADRELNYSTKLIEKGRQEVTANSTRFFAPKLNRVTDALAADEKGRIWVVTRDRQIRKEEEVTIMVSGSVTGGSTRKVVGDTDMRTTDMYKLEVFGPDGVLLGAIPVTHFVDGIWIHQDRLFLIDRDRGVQFYEYRIRENQ
jgi:sugar lactone lactonase YvrE